MCVLIMNYMDGSLFIFFFYLYYLMYIILLYYIFIVKFGVFDILKDLFLILYIKVFFR